MIDHFIIVDFHEAITKSFLLSLKNIFIRYFKTLYNILLYLYLEDDSNF